MGPTAQLLIKKVLHACLQEDLMGTLQLLLLMPGQVAYRFLTSKQPAMGDLVQWTWGACCGLCAVECRSLSAYSPGGQSSLGIFEVPPRGP